MRNGRPQSVEFIGGLYNEYEHATGWHQQRPDMSRVKVP
jgi:hypothetical protein